jgi:putative Mg2+ transporter-C (MgtC) family protein
MDIINLLAPLKLEAILTAFVCGLIIGTERQISNKPAGIRTSILICLGTYIFIVTSQLVQVSTSDPARVIGQIVTGIGFLGAGVILTREGVVIGITSASVIWILASIGVLIGLENYISAISISIITVLVLIGINILEKYLKILEKDLYPKLSHKTKKLSENQDN